MTTKPSFFLRPFAAIALFFLSATTTLAQSAIATGTISGRVQDAVTGRYLNNARVTVESANRDTFTNQLGEYHLAELPPGEVTLRVFYTGQQPQTATVTVAAGQNTARDFSLHGVFESPRPRRHHCRRQTRRRARARRVHRRVEESPRAPPRSRSTSSISPPTSRPSSPSPPSATSARTTSASSSSSCPASRPSTAT